jgi:adenylate kinase family enzyme
MQRVSVVGVTGSGKTTLAATLATRLRAPHIELDALHWEPNWTMAELEVFRARVTAALSASERWVVDGNYSKARDLVWARADTVVWLDYSFAVIFGRLLRRTLRRVRSNEELWNGNREDLRTQFLQPDSLFVWAIKTYPRYRTAIPAALSSDSYRHLALVRLRKPAEARAWLVSIDAWAF